MEYLKNINESIKRYLEIENSDYAILINGSWGSGKTHYFQNNIGNIIDRIENKDYQYIYISLYGVNNFEEITKNIMWQVATGTKGMENKVKFFGSKLATIMSDVSFGKLGIADNPLKDFLDRSDELNLEDIILCFDDLERSHISPNKIFGYINGFVEHQNIKTFIIGHEKKLEEMFIKENIENKWDIALKWIDLNKENNENETSKKKVNKEIENIFNEYNYYKQMKEKLIGKTIAFSPKYDYYDKVVLENLISNFDDDNYKDFITNNKSEIAKIFELNDHNIRSLRHSLDDFNILYKKLNDKISKRLLKRIFCFSMICTFENKNNNISLVKLKGIDYSSVRATYLFNGETEDKNIQSFFAKYFNEGIEFEIINSIVDYIITGYLNIELLNKEISYLKEKKSKTTLELMEKFWKLTDQKFEESLSLLTQELENGKYRLSTYPQIYKIYVTIHNMGLLDLSFEELKKLFIDSIEKSFEKNSSEDFIESSFIPGERISQKYNDFYRELEEIIKNKNQELKKIEDKEKIDEILNKNNNVYDGLSNFIRKTNNISDFYMYVDNEKLVNKLNNLNNEELNNVVNLLINKTKEISVDEKIKPNLMNLKELIDREFNLDNKKLSSGIIKRFYNFIENKIEYI